MHGTASTSAKPEAILSAPPSTPSSRDVPSATRSPPRRQKPRHVIYKSSALQRAAPSLVAAAAPAAITATRAIQRASDEAERVRDQFKLAKCGPEIDVGEGDDEATNAKKYERRLLMNRHSAAASRVRREAYTKALEAQLVEQEAVLNETAKLLQIEREKNKMLLETSDDPHPDDDHHDHDIHDDASDRTSDIPHLDHPNDEPHSALPEVAPDDTLGSAVETAPAPSFPLESQTDDNSNQLAAVLPPFAPPQAPQSLRPLQHQIPKTEEVIPTDPNLDEILMSSNDRILECFLREDPGQVEFDMLDLL